MSAVFSPFLGIIIDKIGKRAVFITASSVLVALACFVMAVCPYSPPGSEDWTCLLPLILVGFGYSIYASALWSSIPYIVKPSTIGSAFGLATSIQAIGLVIAPFCTGLLLNKNPGRFVSTYIFLGFLSLIGMGANIWLYIDDIKNRDGVLDKVPKSIEELMTSPKSDGRASMPGTTDPTAEDELVMNTEIDQYGQDGDIRNSLKKQIGKQYPNQ